MLWTPVCMSVRLKWRDFRWLCCRLGLRSISLMSCDLRWASLQYRAISVLINHFIRNYPRALHHYPNDNNLNVSFFIILSCLKPLGYFNSKTYLIFLTYFTHRVLSKCVRTSLNDLTFKPLKSLGKTLHSTSS